MLAIAFFYDDHSLLITPFPDGARIELIAQGVSQKVEAAHCACYYRNESEMQ